MAELEEAGKFEATTKTGAKDETPSLLLEGIWDKSAGSANRELAQVAGQLQGTELWLDHPQATQQGRYGAMAALSKVIQFAHGDEGMDDFDELSIRKGVEELSSNKNWTVHKTLKPGDMAVVLHQTRGEGPAPVVEDGKLNLDNLLKYPSRFANAGIVADDGKSILCNSSSTGKWEKKSLESFLGTRPVQDLFSVRAPEKLHAVEVPAPKKLNAVE